MTLPIVWRISLINHKDSCRKGSSFSKLIVLINFNIEGKFLLAVPSRKALCSISCWWRLCSSIFSWGIEVHLNISAAMESWLFCPLQCSMRAKVGKLTAGSIPYGALLLCLLLAWCSRHSKQYNPFVLMKSNHQSLIVELLLNHQFTLTNVIS